MAEQEVAPHGLVPGQNCWRIETANRFAFIVDGAAFFVALRQAMLTARHQITLIGWDFDARIALGDPSEDHGPKRLGDFILWLADRTPELQIRLLRWDTGALKSMLRGNSLLTVLRWKAHPRITLKLDAAHPFTSSHHQKIVVIDDSIAFCGGIDITMQRWDTRAHLDDDPLRVTPRGKPLGPWHDATSAFDGDAAQAMGDLARARWFAATGEDLPPSPTCHDCWPTGPAAAPGLAPHFRDMKLAIARTLPKMEGQEPVHEIERSWIDMILSAKRMIYAESQYLASRKVAHAIATRLAEDDPPEIVLINPFQASGWLEPLAMDTARARLVEAIKRIDHADRFRIYHPRTTKGTWIYVHAKVMVVDDHILRVGSSNFNNRSMRLDTECDVMLSAELPENQHLKDDIGVLRDDLLAEHLGVSRAKITQALQETGSLIGVIERFRGAGRSLVPYELPEHSSFAQWLAENEILDPNGPDDLFESPSRRGLFKGWDRLRSQLRRRKLALKRRINARRGAAGSE